ncbi:hypothetical protein P0C22_06025 [Plesiomonas shigelloides]|uniref:hypothetical protein n=1 Tax=Plesiomonas shigelloides TaxID=703 RepID=UPI0030C42594
MASLDVLFDSALQRADEAIMEHMAADFIFELSSGQQRSIRAIYDSQQSLGKGSGSSTSPRPFAAVCEHGALSVLGERLERALMGAKVKTPQGMRMVVDVIYPDAISTILVLGLVSEQRLPSGNGVRFTR